MSCTSAAVVIVTVTSSLMDTGIVYFCLSDTILLQLRCFLFALNFMVFSCMLCPVIGNSEKQIDFLCNFKLCDILDVVLHTKIVGSV